MISRFQEFVAPFSPDQFFEILRERKLVFRRGTHLGRMDGLLSWDAMLQLVESGKVPADKVRLLRNSSRSPTVFFTDGGKTNPEKLRQLFEKGVSLVIEPVERYVPEIQKLCDDIAAACGEHIMAGAVATTGGGGAFVQHYDPEDFAIVQLEGSKRWRVYDTPVPDPVRDMPPQLAPAGEPIFDEMLQPGDFLFLPAGYWHCCENGPGRSLHISMVFRPPTGIQGVQTLLTDAMDDPIFRRPLTRLHDPTERAAHLAALKARLLKMIDRL
ncbi:MAG: hypothetical protein JSR60_13435 [Proteobacteria bacterium]|nr:hypothetical protein [Pseudomonadota bacterium]